MQLTVTADNIEQARRELRALAGRAQDLAPVLAQFGIHMVRSVEMTFEAGGRPTPWLPSRRALTSGGKTLINSARLKNSMVARVTGPRELTIGTNVAYAAVHQMGFNGTVQIPQHLRRVKSRDLHGTERRVSKKTGRDYEAKTRIATGFAVVKAHPANLRIPARPFLLAQDEDLDLLQQMLLDYLRGSGQ